MAKCPDNPCSFKYFGDELIKSEDLDPVYVALVKANLGDNALKRMLLAYWCYYSLGTASRIVDAGPDKFYEAMWQAHYEKWPHGFERRYFYGDMAKNTINGLEEFGSPAKVVDKMTMHGTFDELNKAALSFYGFGMWMGWKIGDMAERVLRYDVDFSNSSLGIYKDPVMGAALLLYGDKHHSLVDGDLVDCCKWLDEDFAEHKSPPHYDRTFNIQEGETVLCKYKAYYYGQYYVGKDIKEIAEGLEHAHELGCDLAQHVLACVPKHYVCDSDPYPYLGSGYAHEVCGLGG